jgi:hypothetical protein
LLAAGGGVVAVLVPLGAFILVGRAGSPVAPGPSHDPGSLPGLELGGPPWAPETANLRARLGVIGFPVLTAEAETLHTHQHLDLFVDGKPVAIPADIGINAAQGFLAPLHTHDTTGIIHVESPVVRTYTLGEFFDAWGLRLTADCLGGTCTGADRILWVWVNGTPYGGDPRDIALQAHEEIVIALGPESEMPNPVPSSYGFPTGL